MMFAEERGNKKKTFSLIKVNRLTTEKRSKQIISERRMESTMFIEK